MSATTLPDRAVIRMSGDSVRDFLQGLVTSDVAGPLPVWTGLLSAQGKCLFDFLVWDDPEASGDVLLDCEAAVADDLIKRLSMYRLRRAIAIGRDEALVVGWSPTGDAGVSDPRLKALGRRWLETRFPPQAADQTGEAAGTLRAPGLPPSRENSNCAIG